MEIPLPKDTTQTDEEASIEDETPVEHPINKHPTPSLPQAQVQAPVPGRQSQQDVDQVQQTGHNTPVPEDLHSTTVPEDQVLVTEILAEQEAQHVQTTQQLLVAEDLAIQQVDPIQQVLIEEDMAEQVQQVNPVQQVLTEEYLAEQVQQVDPFQQVLVAEDLAEQVQHAHVEQVQDEQVLTPENDEQIPSETDDTQTLAHEGEDASFLEEIEQKTSPKNSKVKGNLLHEAGDDHIPDRLDGDEGPCMQNNPDEEPDADEGLDAVAELETVEEPDANGELDAVEETDVDEELDADHETEPPDE